jgi:hypothetical protein
MKWNDPLCLPTAIFSTFDAHWKYSNFPVPFNNTGKKEGDLCIIFPNELNWTCTLVCFQEESNSDATNCAKQ